MHLFTLWYLAIYLFCVYAMTKSVSFIEFLRKCCIYDEILHMLGKRIIKFEGLKNRFTCR